MTLWSRAFYGALIGAILTLLAHSSSRPFLAGPFVESAALIEGRHDDLPLSFPEVLPDPKDDLTASLWVHVGAEQILKASQLSTPQLRGLVKIADYRRTQDPTNGFWGMAKAIFEHELGDDKAAKQSWVQASKCLSFNDFQSRYLSGLRASLARSSATNTWQYAYCYRLRSMAFASLVEMFARHLVSQTTRVSEEDLRLRYVTMLNGGLLRDWSRNLAIMERGISVVELASHPKELQREASIKRLLIAHSEFKEAMKSVGMTREAELSELAYNENEGWGALTAREDTDEKVANLTLYSAIWPNMPGVLLQCAFLGSFLALVGLGLEKLVRRNEKLASIAIATIALVISLAVYALTTSLLALVASGLCCLFVLLTPRNPRAHLPKDLGPLFSFVMVVLALTFVFLGSVMLLTRTLPVVANSAAFDPHIATIVDSRITAGLTLIAISCLFLFAPLWALAQHIRTFFVLSRGFYTLGVIAMSISLFLSVAATPVCVYFEKENQETFRKLLENEPVYYVSQ